MEKADADGRFAPVQVFSGQRALLAPAKDVFALVDATFRTCVVLQCGLSALRAGNHIGPCGFLMRSTLVPPRLGYFPLGYRHETSPKYLIFKYKNTYFSIVW